MISELRSETHLLKTHLVLVRIDVLSPSVNLNDIIYFVWFHLKEVVLFIALSTETLKVAVLKAKQLIFLFLSFVLQYIWLLVKIYGERGGIFLLVVSDAG